MDDRAKLDLRSTPASEWPPIPADGVERLRWWQEHRANRERGVKSAEEEQERVETLVARRRAGERLLAHEEAAIADSPFESAAECRCKASIVRS